MSIERKSFGRLADGRDAGLYELRNGRGMAARVSDIGCAVVSLLVPDKAGAPRDVVFGMDSAAEYAVNPSFFGVVVGRVANRIGYGAFKLDGKAYKLETNDGRHHLHGGSNGFDKRLWETERCDETANAITFKLVSPDGDSGYPGELTARVTYTLTQGNVFRVDYSAEADSKTICNLTNHSYFNLNGHGAGYVGGHVMQIFSDRLTAVDDALIPTGGYTDVAGTAFDFRQPKAIGQDIEAAGGYDHNYVLNGADAARAYSEESGITLAVRTSSPGMQFYSGNFLTGDVRGKGGVFYPKRAGFCLETQFFPDSVNQPGFPSCVVEKAKPQKYFTEFAFGVL